jgi:hypothetical protein
VDAVQRCCLRRQASAGLAATADVEHGDVARLRHPPQYTLASNSERTQKIEHSGDAPPANRDRSNDGFAPTATSIAAIRNYRFTPTPAPSAVRRFAPCDYLRLVVGAAQDVARWVGFGYEGHNPGRRHPPRLYSCYTGGGMFAPRSVYLVLAFLCRPVRQQIAWTRAKGERRGRR